METAAGERGELECVACPSAGSCGGQFTANTMAIAFEFLGISPMGRNGVPVYVLYKNGSAPVVLKLIAAPSV